MTSGGAPEPLRLLIVDDDDLDRMAVRRALSSAEENVVIVEAIDARGALERLRGRTFDCVLLDFNLPDHDGLWVLEQLHADATLVPVIVLTGQEDPKTAAELMKSGAYDYLPKDGWTPARLLQSIGQAMRLHRVETERVELLRREREARAQVEAERARLENFLRHTPAFIVITRGPDHLVEFVNQPVIDLCEGASLVGLRYEEAFAAVAEPFLPILNEAFASGSSFEGRELAARIATLDGASSETRYFTLMVQPQRDSQGRVDGLITVALEVSEQVRARHRVEALAEFQDQLIGIVSHDVRSPLAAILMSAQVLHRPNLDEAILRAIARIERGGRRIDQIISLLLDFTRARIGGGIPVLPEPVDLLELCHRVIEEFRGTHPHQRIECRISPLVVEVDPARMSQVLANLIDNALKYGASDAPVTISGGRDEHGELRISVSNAGAPIPEDVRREMFEPFQRGTQSDETIKKSLGLGLYIVRELVRAHGGRIEVRSSASDGTTFTVVLPHPHPDLLHG